MAERGMGVSWLSYWKDGPSQNIKRTNSGSTHTKHTLAGAVNIFSRQASCACSSLMLRIKIGKVGVVVFLFFFVQKKKHRASSSLENPSSAFAECTNCA